MSEHWDITVMLGGPSEEREVSLQSGKAVVEALDSLGHRVTPLDPIPGEWSLPEKVDLVFLALHGTYGEDGAIQAELEKLGVPYTGCGPAASALAFDKVKSKQVFEEQGIPTARFTICDSAHSEKPESFGLPVVLKPAKQGSSVGVEILSSYEDWDSMVKQVLSFGGQALIEEFVEGREITVGIVDGEVLPIVEVRPKNGYYDYHNKYTSGATEYLCPASFSPDVTHSIETAAVEALKAIGGGMYARVDFIVRETELFVLEVNTLPGMTATSLLPKSAEARGESFPELCHRLAKLALNPEGSKAPNVS